MVNSSSQGCMEKGCKIVAIYYYQIVNVLMRAFPVVIQFKYFTLGTQNSQGIPIANQFSGFTP